MNVVQVAFHCVLDIELLRAGFHSNPYICHWGNTFTWRIWWNHKAGVGEGGQNPGVLRSRLEFSLFTSAGIWDTGRSKLKAGVRWVSWCISLSWPVLGLRSPTACPHKTPLVYWSEENLDPRESLLCSKSLFFLCEYHQILHWAQGVLFVSFYWHIIDLQCVTFCCTAKWINYTYTHSF